MTAGSVLFARYAYPPNALGYCGPADSGALLEYAAGPVSDAGLAALARRFSGAWPYLVLRLGLTDPRDRGPVATPRLPASRTVAGSPEDEVGHRPAQGPVGHP